MYSLSLSAQQLQKPDPDSELIFNKYENLRPSPVQQMKAPFMDHDTPEARWTPQNTGTDALSTFYVVDGFVDSQGRYYFMSASHANNAIDVLDGSSWSQLIPGENIPSSPNGMVEDSQGSIWVLADDGAYQYSSSWELQSTYQVLLEDTLSSIIGRALTDSEGRIWFSHAPQTEYNFDLNMYEITKKGGVTVYDPEAGAAIARTDTISSDLVKSIDVGFIADMALGNNGEVWVAVSGTDSTSGGVAVFDASLNSAETFTTDNTNLPFDAVRSMALDQNGNMWVSFADTLNPIAYYDGSQWNEYEAIVDPFDYYCYDLTMGSDNQLYCGKWTGTLVYDGSSWNEMPETADGQSFTGITDIYSNQNGADLFVKYVTTKPGAFTKEGDTWTHYSSWGDNGLFSRVVFGLAADNANNGLWAGGFYGTAYFDGTDWTYYDNTDGLADRYSWKIHVGADGTVWFGSANNGITYYRDGEFTVFDEYGTFVETIFEDKDENIWMGSYDATGILQYDGSNFIHHDTLDGVIGQLVLSIAQGPDDNIYAGTSAPHTVPSLARYDGSEWTSWTPDSSESFDPYEIASDKDQNLWLVGDSLLKWDGSTLTQYPYPEDNQLGSSYHIEPDPNGNIWIAYGNDVHIFDVSDETWTRVQVEGSGVYDIEHDDDGSTWLGVYRGGIYKFNTAEAVSVESEMGVPEKFTLEQNYPNPFNPSTVISYQLPVNSMVRVEVFDMLGRKIATLVDGQHQSAGQHQVTFDASGLSSGMYIYRIESGQFTASKKMLLIK